MKAVNCLVLSLIILLFPISARAASASASASSSSNGASAAASAEAFSQASSENTAVSSSSSSIEQPATLPPRPSTRYVVKPQVELAAQPTPTPQETPTNQTLSLNNEAKAQIDKIQNSENDITAKVSEIEKRQIKTLKLYLASLIAIFLIIILQIIIIIHSSRQSKEEITSHL